MRSAVALSFPLILLTGCALGPSAAPTPQQGLSIRGTVHGGQQPIVGSHVYLFAANTTGYGKPSVSTLNPTVPSVATDSVGAYVATDTSGSFSITGDYTCTTGTQLYLYALAATLERATTPRLVYSLSWASVLPPAPSLPTFPSS